MEGGFEAWKKAALEYDTVSQISAEDFKDVLETSDEPTFDVRKEGEYQTEHVLKANNTPLGFLNDHLAEFPNNKPIYVHCAGGYRSMIASSILKSRGIHNLIDVMGGFDELKEVGVSVSGYVGPSTL